MDNHITPTWIFSLADYCQMFDLTNEDLTRPILDYPGGISSFNAEMHLSGHRVLSGDQHYTLSASEMQQYAENIYQRTVKHLRQHVDRLKRSDEEAIANIVTAWQKSKEQFLADYPVGKKEGRYQSMQLPHLPFNNHDFVLALCSDFLFHTQARKNYTPEQLITELCRVANEVRVFPLLTESGVMAEALGPVMLTLQQQNFGVEVREVSYEQQKGGNAMLRIWAKECVVEK